MPCTMWVLLCSTQSTHLIFYFIFKLAESPTVQQKLRMEILNSVESEKNLDFDKLCSLPYLEQVVYG